MNLIIKYGEYNPHSGYEVDNIEADKYELRDGFLILYNKKLDENLMIPFRIYKDFYKMTIFS